MNGDSRGEESSSSELGCSNMIFLFESRDVEANGLGSVGIWALSVVLTSSVGGSLYSARKDVV